MRRKKIRQSRQSLFHSKVGSTRQKVRPTLPSRPKLAKFEPEDLALVLHSIPTKAFQPSKTIPNLTDQPPTEPDWKET